MNKKSLLILGWHQIYLSANAGGYVRLKEFVKRIPKEISFFLLDNKPSLYTSEITSSNLVVYDTPHALKSLRKKFFLIWLLIETIAAGFVVYKMADKLIKKNQIKVIYVPIGEFPQLYLPGIFLKRKYPEIKLVVDILNFELPEKSWTAYFRKLRKSGVGLFRSFVTIVMFYIGYFLTIRTITIVDYIFTVSPELVKKIKKVYKKKTIDFTPSGVSNNLVVNSKTKKYLGVYVGRITIQKGIMDLISVWEKVVIHKSKALLGIVGHIDPALHQKVKKELKARKLEENVIFLGQVNDKEKFKILSESEIFLHLARYEPLFPVIGILEGLAAGLFTIVYDMPVIASQNKLLHSESALAVTKNGNTQEVTERILKYSKLSAMKKNSLTTAAKKFAKLYDWDIIAKKEFTIIQKLITS